MAAPLLALTTMATLATASIPVIQTYSQPIMAHASKISSDQIPINGKTQIERDGQAANQRQAGRREQGSAKLAEEGAKFGYKLRHGSLKGYNKTAIAKQISKLKAKGKADANNQTQGTGGNSGSNGNYKSLQPPSMLSTALYDGLGIAQQTADSGSKKAYDTFEDNLSKIMGVQNDMGHTLFSNTGAMYGAIGLSNNSTASNVIQKQSADTHFLKENFGKQGMYYYDFGLAYTDLSNRAAKSDPSNMSTKSFVDGFNGLAASVSIIGLSILQKINPFPVVMTMFDSNVRHDPKYAHGADKNAFIGLINDHAMFYGLTDFFGNHIGNTSLTMSNMIVIAIMLISLGLAGVTSLMNGRQWGITARKFMSKVFIFSVAVPLTSLIFTLGLNTLKDVVSGKQSRSQTTLIKDNLDLGDWAKAAKFGLPPNMNLNIESGQFVLDENTIQKINLYTMYKAGVIKDFKATKANIKAATKYIQQRASQSDNKTTVNWQDTTRESDGLPYSTSGLIQVANSFGQNQKISLSKKDMNNIAYLSYASLNTSNGKTFHMDGSKQSSDFGLTPLAAYNILNTNFDKNGLSVNSNINSPQVPTVAIGANTYSDASLMKTGNKPSGVLLFFLNIIMMSAAFKALARIFTTGFGSVLHGGGSATFGTATGWGELIGGVVALTFGVIGLSLVITGVQYGFELLFKVIVGAINKALEGNPLIHMLSGVKDDVQDIKFFGGFLADIVQGVINLIVTVVMLILAPKFIKIPIEAYGSWIEGLPGMIAEKVQEIENRFTGDYRAGGRVGSNIRNATEKQFAENKQHHDQKSRERKDALRTAGGVLLGMGAAKGLGVLGLGKGKKNDSVNPQPGTTGDDNGKNPDSQPNIAPDDSPEGVTNTTNTGDNKTEQNNNKSDSKSGDDMSRTDATSDESVNAQGDNVKDDVNNLEGNTEAVDAIDDVDSSESVAPAGDSVDAADSVNNPSEQQGNPDAEVNGDQSVNSTQNNNVDKSNSNDKDVDSSQSVNNDNTNNTEGNDVDSSNTSADAKNDINSTSNMSNANDARKVDKGQSVSNQGNLNKNSVNNGRSTDNTTNVGKSQSVSNTTKNSKSSGINDKAKGIAGKIKNAGPQAKGSGKTSAVKSVIGNITKQSKGSVGDKERVSMAVAHAAAAMVGAQGLTQSGMNHIQHRDASSAFKPSNGHQQSVQGPSKPNKVQDVKTGGLKAEAEAPSIKPSNGSNVNGAKPSKGGQSFFKTVKGFNPKDSKGK